MQPIWIPDEQTIAHSNIRATLDRQSLADYDQFYQWSIGAPGAFWGDVVETLGIRFHQAPERTLDTDQIASSFCWFPGARLNIAESCFQAELDQPAIVHGGPEGDLHTMSYGEVWQLAGRVAGGLRHMGLQPGDAVAIFLPMTARSVAVYLGAILAGCVVVSIADSFAKDELRSRLRIGGAKAIFVEASAERDGKRLALYDRVVAVAGPASILVDDQLDAETFVRAGDLRWSEFLGEPDFDEVVYSTPDTPINVLFSSGTTGDPKAVPWDHTTPIKGASDGHFHQDIHPGDVVAWPTNLGWMMGPWLIFATMINRGTLALFEGAPTGESFGRFVQDARVNMLGVVPSLVRRWRQTGCMEALDWSSIRVFSSTGECSNPRDMRYLSELAGGKPIIEYCGGTEIGGGYVASTVVQPNRASTFSTPTLGTALVILDEQGEPSETGEVFLVPPVVGFSHRLLNRDHDLIYHDGTPPGPDGKALRRHGDQLEKLPDGSMRAIGRADDTMNLGGIKVGAAEIERVVADLPQVEEVAAIALSPPEGGPSRLILCVGIGLAAPIDAKALQAEMQRAIKTRLNPLFKVDDLLVVEKLPRTASNKIIRRQLRTECEQHQS